MSTTNAYMLCPAPAEDAEIWQRIHSRTPYTIDGQVILKYPDDEDPAESDAETYNGTVHDHAGIIAVISAWQEREEARESLSSVLTGSS